MKNLIAICCAVCAALSALLPSCNSSRNELAELRDGFITPPDSVRPGVYWYFMDGNLSKEGMTKDLEAMKEAGIGSVLFLEVNVGVPRGNVDFMSDEWIDCFRHAVGECERLGIAMTLGIGPGWTGSGGPWVEGAQSMQHLVGSTTEVAGGSEHTVSLPVPDPMPPFFGDAPFTPELRDRWMEFYDDVAVLAFPTPTGNSAVKDVNEKALYYRSPFSSDPSTKQFLPRDNSPVDPADIIPSDKIVDLTSLLTPEGTITWDFPEGNWTVMRIGARNNGAVTRPAPLPGVGFECDKADSTALIAHLKVFTDKLMAAVGERDRSLQGGLKQLHMDSWEMGAQNWTPKLREEFTRRRGYDPQPFYPVYRGFIVDSPEISERFLWDLRQTLQELMLEHHAGAVRRYAHDHGMRLSVEPYDMNPMQDMELAAACDIPMCEFWSPGWFNTTFSAVEGSSVGNLIGQRVVPAESFTHASDGWKQHPASMKNQTDWAFCAGINKLYFHTFEHQALADSLRPGMTMGMYGIHWDRGQTWWPYVGAYHKYIARCQFMLQKGRTVADILYLAPEEAPFPFKAPASALDNEFLIDKKGHNFDACPPSLLYGATVNDGRILFPSGAEYSLLVLPDFQAMTPRMLEKISQLVKEGANVVGLPPQQTPGLEEYPESERRLADMVADLWGGMEIPAGLQSQPYGKGTIWWGTDLKDSADNLYPAYDITSAILSSIGVDEDFTTDSGDVRYIHKVTPGGIHYYLVSNRTDKPVTTTARFRVEGRQPQLWHPATGEMRPLPEYESSDGYTSIPLRFEPDESYFIMYAGKPEKHAPEARNFRDKRILLALDTDWHINFDPKWGGPASVDFPLLVDWSTCGNNGIRYYSGTAIYTRKFNLDSPLEGEAILSLGNVADIARVWLNGKDLGVVWCKPWEVNVTEALQPGENELRIEVTNAWVNRLIGDELLPDDGIADGQWPDWLLKGEPRPSERYTFATHKHYTKDSELIRSGLLGPVRLLTLR